MYKDKEREKEASKERMRRHRKGVTKEGVTDQGVTRITNIKGELNDPGVIQGIEEGSKIFNDRSIRYERAYRYKLWREGRRTDGVDSGTGVKLLMMCQSLANHKMLGEVRYGVSGPTMDVVSEYLTTSK